MLGHEGSGVDHPYCEPDVLTRQQVNQCLMEIEDIHPLRQKAFFCKDVIPFLSCFHTKEDERADFRNALRKSLMADLDITISEDMREQNKMLKDDPFLYLGYGVNAYFRILYQMMNLFIIVTIFYLPIFAVYSNNSAKALKGQPSYGINQYSLGNIGGSGVECATAEIRQKSLELTCPSGSEIVCDKIQFGAISKMMTRRDYCLNSVIKTDIKELNKNAKIKKIECSTNFDSSFSKNIIASCKKAAALKKKQGSHLDEHKIDFTTKAKGASKYYPFQAKLSAAA